MTPPSSKAEPLGRRASFWVSAGVVAHTLWTSAAPAMAYPLYAKLWHLEHETITAIFAVYPVVVVAVLTVFGGLSDSIGRRAAMLLGLAASLLGVLAFALAPDVAWLFAGRALMGVGVGLTAGPSTAAMLEFGTSPGRASSAASSVTTASQAVGMASALMLGGALVQYAPWPTHLSFWLLFALLLALFAAAWRLPRPDARDDAEPARRWRPSAPAIAPALRRRFAVAAIAVATAYTHGAVLLSLGGQVAHDLVGSTNALVNGFTLSLFAVLFGIAGIAARPLHHRRAMLLGAVASAAGMGLLVLAVAEHALPVFLLATGVSGTGYSLLVFGGLELLTSAAPAEHRGGALSALYLVAYLAMGSLALLLGVVATHAGLAWAIDLGAGGIVLASVITGLLVARLPIPGMPRPGASAPPDSPATLTRVRAS